MQLRVIQRILGLLLMVFSVTMLPPVLVGLIYGDGAIGAFLTGFLVTFVAGFLLWLPVRRFVRDLHLRDGFIIVVMFWSVLALFGSLPFMLGPGLNMSFTEALFESMSGLTTTGATVIVGLDSLPKALLFYRQELQWLGGMGIIVLAIAILPMFGIGGMQLYRAETPGPMKDNKLTPRITETAKALWYIYLGLTVSCALAYWAFGMSGFDAISHSFSTVAIGGFSTHDASIGYFNSAAIEGVAIVFMLLAGVNFALHFVAVRNMRVSAYWADAEFRAYLFVLFIVAVIACSYLYFNHTFDSVGSTIHHGLFQVISIGT
ncbi:MAG: potassium transporter, partial [Gammaproteobacteria bacterium]|nr:potassium transporter [Gammaproteobacteria bacterium]